MTTTNKFKRAHRIIEAGLAAAKDQNAVYSIEAIQLHERYCEPGYDGEYIALGNWNSITRYDKATNKFETIDDTPQRVGEALEKLGFEIEWEDEWTACSNCSGLVRTQANSYSWQRAYIDDNGEVVCHECVAQAPADYLELFEGKSNTAWTLSDINLEDFGYAQVAKEFENGWYGGQNDDPKGIAESLRKMGIKRFLFDITGVGQFETRFRVLVHESEMQKFSEEAFDEDETTGPDPAVVMQQALQNIPVVSNPGPGVVYHKINDDGTVETKIISPEDFVNKGVR